MKKLVVLLLIVGTLLSLVACSKEDVLNKYLPLKAGYTLNVGESNKFVNSEKKAVEPVTQNRVISVEYVLKYAIEPTEGDGITYESYSGKYYYWQKVETRDDVILGEKTTTTKTTYEYLVYGEKENIAVRTVTEVETTYNFKGGFEDYKYDKTYDIDVISLADTIEELKDYLPVLTQQYVTETTNKYYVDVTTPTSRSYSESNYTSTYFYLTKNAE